MDSIIWRRFKFVDSVLTCYPSPKARHPWFLQLLVSFSGSHTARSAPTTGPVNISRRATDAILALQVPLESLS